MKFLHRLHVYHLVFSRIMLELQAGGIENDWKTSKFLISSIKGIRTPRHIDNNVDYFFKKTEKQKKGKTLKKRIFFVNVENIKNFDPTPQCNIWSSNHHSTSSQQQPSLQKDQDEQGNVHIIYYNPP